jgi:hypothetical protein
MGHGLAPQGEPEPPLSDSRTSGAEDASHASLVSLVTLVTLGHVRNNWTFEQAQTVQTSIYRGDRL